MPGAADNISRGHIIFVMPTALNTQQVVIIVKNFQNELLFEICSKSLVRAIGKVLLIKFS